MAGFGEGLHVQHPGMSSEMPSCPVPLASGTAGRIPAVLAGCFVDFYVDFVFPVPGPGCGFWTAWPGGVTPCRDTGDRDGIKPVRAGALCVSHRTRRILRQSWVALVALPAPLSPREQPGHCHLPEQQRGHRAVSEPFWGIAKPGINQAAG